MYPSKVKMDNLNYSYRQSKLASKTGLIQKKHPINSPRLFFKNRRFGPDN